MASARIENEIETTSYYDSLSDDMQEIVDYVAEDACGDGDKLPYCNDCICCTARKIKTGEA